MYRFAIIYYTVKVKCEKDRSWWDLEKIPQADEEILKANNGIPCEDSGNMGLACDGCPFCKMYKRERYVERETEIEREYTGKSKRTCREKREIHPPSGESS